MNSSKGNKHFQKFASDYANFTHIMAASGTFSIRLILIKKIINN
jgi:hypothetical protein